MKVVRSDAKSAMLEMLVSESAVWSRVGTPNSVKGLKKASDSRSLTWLIAQEAVTRTGATCADLARALLCKLQGRKRSSEKQRGTRCPWS